MDSAPSRPTKNSSTIPSLISKICRRGSIEVLSSHSLKPIKESSHEVDSSDPKIHPHPSDKEEEMINTLFVAVSALKLAYIGLQKAHIPYQPNKIRVADALVVSELESLSQLENLYRGSCLSVEIQEHQELVEELQSRIQSQETKILNLKSELKDLNQKNKEIEEELEGKASPDSVLLMLQHELTTGVFSDVVRLASKSIHEFSKPLISLMKASRWDLDRAADAIENSVVFTERSHKKYAFESYLSRAMLSCGNDDWFKLQNFDRVMGFREPFDALLDDPDSDFATFCRLKYVVAVHSQMEYSFFDNLDQRAFVLGGGHPRTPFYQAFVRMARWVWALQVLAHSFIPKAEIFTSRKGAIYSEEYMESVVNLAMARGEERFRVGLTVMPGFKIGRDVIQCRVYLYRMESSC